MGDVTTRSGRRRVPLSVDALRRELAGPGGIVSSLRVLPQCPSTNAAMRTQAAELADLAVLATDHQTAGVGRLSRDWITPARAALTWSILLRPAPDHPSANPGVWGWLPLLTGLALTDVLRRDGVAAGLKWPNDVLVPDPERGLAKVAGILCEATAAPTPTMIIGVGVNVCQQRDELPPPNGAFASAALPATSLSLAGTAVDRELLLAAMIRQVVALVGRWRDHAGDVSGSGLADQVRARTLTLGREVTVHLPGGATFDGLAEAIDDEARLVVRTPGGAARAVSAGDVVHLRSAP